MNAGAVRLQRLEAYLAQDPDNGPLLAEAFDLALECGDLARAARYLATCLTAGPLARTPPWEYRRAVLLWAQGDAAGALAALQACTAQLPVPWPPAVQALWLRLQHRLGLLEQAWQWVEVARGQGALDPAAAGIASLVAFDLDRLPEALALADLSLAQAGAPAEALVARGTVALAQRDLGTATRWLEQALQDPSAHGRASFGLGLACLLQRDLAGAAAQLQQATQGMPNHVGSWLALGWARLLAGQVQAALAAFRRALDLDPAFAESQAAVGLALALAGDSRAAAHLARAERLDRSSVTARYARALLAGEANDLQHLQRLAERMLDREGPLGGRLGDWVAATRPGSSG